MRRAIFIFIFLLAGASRILSQPAEYKMTREEYVEKYKDDAIKEMLWHRIPASITLAQGMLESGNGNSALAMYANNHFGIKCHENWNGMTYTWDDNEKNECFRKYNTVLESYEDHSQFLMSRDRYSFLFNLKTTDYRGWAHGLSEAGYATDPEYAQKLIQIIEAYKLYKYDRMVLMPEKQTTSDPKDEQPQIKPVQNTIQFNNELKYVVAKPGDTYSTLAKELDVTVKQLKRYNESNRNDVLKTGEFVYLQSKRRRSFFVDSYTVKKGDSMYSISQQFGIKLKHLYRKNNMKPGEEPKPGDVLNLEHKKRS
ncbi:MAG TPA: glucosaminidase domain-containing protein [Bacteroidia bacterium]|jgi:LysM repeat protein